MSKILIYLGLYYTDELLKRLEASGKNHIQKAPHNFQKKLVKGLLAAEDVTVHQIIIPPLGSYLIASDQMVIPASETDRFTEIGYLNLPGVKNCSQEQKTYAKMKKIIRNAHSDDSVSVLIYSLFEPYIRAAYRIKKEYPNVQVAVLHTDCVPGREDMEIYMSKRAVRRGNRIVKMTQLFDRFILLSKYLHEPLEVGERPYMICETIADGTPQECVIPEKKNVFLYAGSVSREYQLLDLVDAFKSVQDAELWLCGNTDSERELEEATAMYQNIKYFGYLNAAQLKEKMDSAAFLINPRRPSGNYTKYSFPSKTAEYLNSGKPTVMYKLEAIPDEYDAYLNYLTGDRPEVMADELNEIIHKDYSTLLAKAKAGKEFLLRNKTSEI